MTFVSWGISTLKVIEYVWASGIDFYLRLLAIPLAAAGCGAVLASFVLLGSGLYTLAVESTHLRREYDLATLDDGIEVTCAGVRMFHPSDTIYHMRRWFGLWVIEGEPGILYLFRCSNVEEGSPDTLAKTVNKNCS